MVLAELSRAEGPLAELHTHRTMPYRNVSRARSRAGLARRREVAQGWLAGAYDVAQHARTTLCFQNRSFVLWD